MFSVITYFCYWYVNQIYFLLPINSVSFMNFDTYKKPKMFLLMIKFGYRFRDDEAFHSITYSLQWGIKPKFQAKQRRLADSLAKIWGLHRKVTSMG
jgi:hypothetical protein